MRKYYMKFFARYYDRFMVKIEFHLHSYRKELIAPLSGRILEVGVGTGVNFQYYADGVEVVALDPSQDMINKAIPKIPKGLNISILPYGINDIPESEKLEEKSFDSIVCTLVLCTIPDPEKALQFFKGLLKPAGQLIVLEHIQHDNKWTAMWYNTVNPVWKVVGDGCHLNRKTPKVILNAGFDLLSKTSENHFKKGLPFYTAKYCIK